MYIDVYVKYPLFFSDLYESFCPQIFEKYSNIKFHENPSSGSRVVPCGRKDSMMKVIVTFRNFAKAPKYTWNHTTRHSRCFREAILKSIWTSLPQLRSTIKVGTSVTSETKRLQDIVIFRTLKFCTLVYLGTSRRDITILHSTSHFPCHTFYSPFITSHKMAYMQTKSTNKISISHGWSLRNVAGFGQLIE